MDQSTAPKAYRFCEEEVVIFRLDPKVFEDGVGPETLHVIPVLDLAMPDRIVHSITRTGTRSKSFISDEEIKVFRATFASQVGAGACTTGQIGRLVGNCRSSRARPTTPGSGSLGRDSGRENP